MPAETSDAADLWSEALKHWQLKDAISTRSCCEQILVVENRHGGALHLLALIAYGEGNLRDALEKSRAAVEGGPHVAVFHNTLGAVLLASEQPDLAEAAFRTAIQIDPKHAEAHGNLGNMLKNRRRYVDAIAQYEEAISIKPEYQEAWQQLGLTFFLERKWKEAIRCLRKALELKPDEPSVFAFLGASLREDGQLIEAETCFRKEISMRPTPEVLQELALVLQQQNRMDEAIGFYLEVLRLCPNNFGAYNNLGLAFATMGKLEEAVQAYEKAISLNPDFPPTYLNVGNLHKNQNRWEQAIFWYEKAIQLKPDYAEAHNNLGLIFQVQGYLFKAIASYETALKHDPSFHGASMNRSNAFLDLGKIQEAISSFRALLSLRPDYHSVHSNLLFTLHHQPNIRQEDIFEEHLQWARQHARQLSPRYNNYSNSREPERRLRIGYLSPDFCGHVVALNLLPIFQHHDRSQFEIICYSNTPREDMITDRLKAHVEQWRYIRHHGDEALCEQIREDQIDILIELAGHTANNRLLVTARRPAPIQINYLGYIHTTGLAEVDYRLTDLHGDPEGVTERFYTEKIIRLPQSAICYDSIQGSPEVQPPPFLKTGRITFGSFNNLTKFNDHVAELWAKVLLEVPQSMLLMKARPLLEPEACAWVRQRFEKFGVSPERIEFLGWISSNMQHLELYHRIDIALDPFPFNGGITSFDALWMGVPIITLAGNSFASRMGVRLLEEIGLSDLISLSKPEYVRLATQLAREPERLRSLRSALRGLLQHSPLMNGAQTTQKIEAALRLAWKTWCQSA